MEINSVGGNNGAILMKTIESNNSVVKTGQGINAENSNSQDNAKYYKNLPGKKDFNKDELLNVNSQLNKFMSLINADLQFTIHEKTNTLMVQVVDTKNDKVLKEFPSHEMLDVMASIREYVGVLLDNRA